MHLSLGQLQSSSGICVEKNQGIPTDYLIFLVSEGARDQACLAAVSSAGSTGRHSSNDIVCTSIFLQPLQPKHREPSDTDPTPTPAQDGPQSGDRYHEWSQNSDLRLSDSLRMFTACLHLR